MFAPLPAPPQDHKRCIHRLKSLCILGRPAADRNTEREQAGQQGEESHQQMEVTPKELPECQPHICRFWILKFFLAPHHNCPRKPSDSPQHYCRRCCSDTAPKLLKLRRREIVAACIEPGCNSCAHLRCLTDDDIKIPQEFLLIEDPTDSDLERVNAITFSERATGQPVDPHKFRFSSLRPKTPKLSTAVLYSHHIQGKRAMVMANSDSKVH